MLFNSSKLRFCGLAVLAAGLLSASVASAASIVVVDHFTSPPDGVSYLVTTKGVLTLTDTMAVSDVLGGYRTTEMELLAGKGEIQTDINAYEPTLATVNSTDEVVGKFVFAYGTKADLNADLTGLYEFAATFTSADQAGANLTLTVTSGGYSSSAMAAIPLGGGTLLIPFTAFSGIDFSSVDQLRYEIVGPESFDAAIDSLTVVPMPAAGWAGLALMGLIGAARIRKSLNA